MSEDFGEKTQAPTEKRRRDATDKGDVPRSQEVTTAFLLLAAAAAIGSAGKILSMSVVKLFAYTVESLPMEPVGPDAMADHIAGIGWTMLAGLAPFVLTLGGVALAVSAVQARGVLTMEPLKPQWSRIDPFKKAKQIWGVRAWAELVKSLLKLAIVSVAVWSVLDTAPADLSALQQTSPFALLLVIQSYTVKILLAAGLAYLALALADYGFQIWQHEKQLKMSREEIKKEYKESEGDQVVKVRRRTMARQLARRRMLLAVSDADVVLANPTHIAVALKYDPARAHAPVVVAMGERIVAERIKKLAKEAGVPIIENKPLARALFATAQVGFPIPIELFVAVAEVLAFVYRTRGSAPSYARA